MWWWMKSVAFQSAFYKHWLNLLHVVCLGNHPHLLLRCHMVFKITISGWNCFLSSSSMAACPTDRTADSKTTSGGNHWQFWRFLHLMINDAQTSALVPSQLFIALLDAEKAPSLSASVAPASLKTAIKTSLGNQLWRVFTQQTTAGKRII